jgi:hypothetical protein
LPPDFAAKLLGQGPGRKRRKREKKERTKGARRIGTYIKVR